MAQMALTLSSSYATASERQLLDSFERLTQKHTALEFAAREEIAELRLQLQQAHAQLADCRAQQLVSSLGFGSLKPPALKDFVMRPQPPPRQLLHRHWIAEEQLLVTKVFAFWKGLLLRSTQDLLRQKLAEVHDRASSQLQSFRSRKPHRLVSCWREALWVHRITSCLAAWRTVAVTEQLKRPVQRIELNAVQKVPSGFNPWWPQEPPAIRPRRTERHLRALERLFCQLPPTQSQILSVWMAWRCLVSSSHATALSKRLQLQPAPICKNPLLIADPAALRSRGLAALTGCGRRLAAAQNSEMCRATFRAWQLKAERQQEIKAEPLRTISRDASTGASPARSAVGQNAFAKASAMMMKRSRSILRFALVGWGILSAASLMQHALSRQRAATSADAVIALALRRAAKLRGPSLQLLWSVWSSMAARQQRRKAGMQEFLSSVLSAWLVAVLRAASQAARGKAAKMSETAERVASLASLRQRHLAAHTKLCRVYVAADGGKDVGDMLPKLLWVWRAACLHSQRAAVARRCNWLCAHLSKVRRTAQVVRDHNQRVVMMAVFEVWLDAMPLRRPSDGRTT